MNHYNKITRQGYIIITHDELVKEFGNGLGKENKTLDKWIINGTVDDEPVQAIIYDFKSEHMYAKYVTKWFIGGDDERSKELIKSIFPNHKVK